MKEAFALRGANNRNDRCFIKIGLEGKIKVLQ
jgi:hypothetical protein